MRTVKGHEIGCTCIASRKRTKALTQKNSVGVRLEQGGFQFDAPSNTPFYMMHSDCTIRGLAIL